MKIRELANLRIAAIALASFTFVFRQRVKGRKEIWVLALYAVAKAIVFILESIRQLKQTAKNISLVD